MTESRPNAHEDLRSAAESALAFVREVGAEFFPDDEKALERAWPSASLGGVSSIGPGREFVLAANPQRILDLLDERDQLAEKLAKVSDERDEARRACRRAADLLTDKYLDHLESRDE